MTPLICWNSSLELGIAPLDRQHMELAALLNQVADCGQDIPDTLALLDSLYTHVRAHFLHEEGMMAEIDFAELNAHHNEHLLLLAELKRFITDTRNAQSTLDHHSLNALKGWLVVHIKSSDRSFAECYRRARINT